MSWAFLGNPSAEPFQLYIWRHEIFKVWIFMQVSDKVFLESFIEERSVQFSGILNSMILLPILNEDFKITVVLIWL